MRRVCVWRSGGSFRLEENVGMFLDDYVSLVKFLEAAFFVGVVVENVEFKGV